MTVVGRYRHNTTKLVSDYDLDKLNKRIEGMIKTGMWELVKPPVHDYTAKNQWDSRDNNTKYTFKGVHVQSKYVAVMRCLPKRQ